MLFYSATAPSGDSKIDVCKMNGTAAFLRHFDNYLFFSFVLTNPRSSRAERAQATTEIAICERELAFWRKHSNYDQAEATRKVVELKRNWRAAA